MADAMPSPRPSGLQPTPTLAFRLTAVLFLVCAGNAGAWLWALVALRHDPALLGLAAVVYGLGLRHAVDGDHIAAIDNVTRRLMHAGQKPVSVGFFFALGHSSIVFLVTIMVASLAHALETFQAFRAVGGAISTAVSALFLITVAAANLTVFHGVYRQYRRSRDGAEGCNDNDPPLRARGLVARILSGLPRLITRSWQMFPLGFVFGLGFETATEVALFGLAASQVGEGAGLASVLVFPVLFAAGMSLLDTLDGLVMLGVYQWAFVEPRRKLVYNMGITLVSALIALLIGGIQAAAFMRTQQRMDGPVWRFFEALGERMGLWGVLIILLLTCGWLVSWLTHRRQTGSPHAASLRIRGAPVRPGPGPRFASVDPFRRNATD